VISVFIADDHAIIREGLAQLLGRHADLSVVGTAADGRESLQRIRALRPDVAVVDISMPGMNGLAATKAIRESTPATAVVALTRYDDDAYVQELLNAGASGYVLKQSPSAELVEAVRAAAAGRRYLDRSLAARVAGTMMNQQGRRTPPSPITERETEVLRLMALGHSNKEIASMLDLSVKTVEVHKTNATRKLGLAGRTDVIRYALLQGWLREP
jgi:DNA-binding NarL/FixJ family response regulator